MKSYYKDNKLLTVTDKEITVFKQVADIKLYPQIYSEI